MIEEIAIRYLEWRKQRYLTRVGVVDADLPVRLMDEYRRTLGSNSESVDEFLARILSVDVGDLRPRLIETDEYRAYKDGVDANLGVFDNKPYQLGAMDLEIDVIAALLSQLDAPEVLEVGVANGYSSAFLYYVLDKTGGRITSIDLPRFSKPPRWPRDIIRFWLARRGKIENTGTLADLNPGGVIPRDKYAGWLVPMRLRTRVPNISVFGDAFTVLPEMKASHFDFVVLDAVKDYDSRLEMFQLVSKHMRPNSYCFQDGYWVNAAFEDFCAQNRFPTWTFGRVGVFATRPMK